MHPSVSDCYRWTKTGEASWPNFAGRRETCPKSWVAAPRPSGLFVSLFRACAESLASENASRLAAMQRADKNIDELLEDLKRTFHRLRQSGIDEELFDVISGFESLSVEEK
jgi:alternate F1F0 ATPase F1 subunit gamma